MKRHAWLAIAVVALTLMEACTTERTEEFEGEVDTTTTSASEASATIRYFIKGERIRVETTADKSTTRIMDISTNDIFVLDSSSRTYRVVNDPHAVHVLRRELFEPSGKRIVTMDADRIAQSKEPSTLFEVPSEYKLVR
jgi:hypothetical protein